VPVGPEGYVLGVLQLDGVIDDAIGAHAPIQAAIGYGNPAGPAMFLTNKPGKNVSLAQWLGDAEFHQEVAFTVAGKPFYLVLRSAQNSSLLTRLYAPAGAALLTLALFISLAQSMITTVLRKHQVEQAVIERTAELRTLNEALGEEVAQRRQVEVALRGAKERAEAANRAKSAFLATMSHELRTPLNAIIGFSDIIKRELFGSLENEKYADYAKDIHDSGSHLLAIINDILDLAKAESGKLQLSEHEFDVTEMLEACIRMCRGRAETGKVDLIFFGGQSEIRTLGDERLLLQVVANLVTNGIKFTAEGGTVRVYVSASPQKGIAIKVSDTGIGIAPENIGRVLRPFEQVETSYSRKHSGSGLGLPYAKRLTELHGGELKIESELAKGTTVTVTLPPSRLVEIRKRAMAKEAV
jgi:signal transduction histidine kinase